MELRAQEIFSGEIIDTFFIRKDDNVIIRLRQTRRDLRQTKPQVYSGIKLPLPNEIIEGLSIKVKDERETEISDFDEMKHILEGSSYTILTTRRKFRTSFKYKNTRFEFDKFQDEHDYIPEFLEIESLTNQEILDFIRILSIPLEDCKDWGFRELSKYYSK